MDKIAKKIVNGLDKVEGNFLGKDIHFLAVDIDEVPDIQVASVPSLIYFKNNICIFLITVGLSTLV